MSARKPSKRVIVRLFAPERWAPYLTKGDAGRLSVFDRRKADCFLQYWSISSRAHRTDSAAVRYDHNARLWCGGCVCLQYSFYVNIGHPLTRNGNRHLNGWPYHRGGY